MNTSISFGALVKQHRQLQGLSQIDLANTLGVHQSTISRFEAGQTDALSEKYVLALCAYFNIDPASARPLEAVYVCPNPTCPLCYLFLVNGQIRGKPASILASPGKTLFCGACGTLMLDQCPGAGCKEPLSQTNAACTSCGHAYAEIPPYLKNIANPKDYLQQHNTNREKYIEITAKH